MRWCLLIVLFSLNWACNKTMEADKEDYSQILDAERVKDIRLRYSDSAFLKAIIEGPELYRYDKGERELFPSGVYATFYSEFGSPNSWLKARRAYRFPNESKVVVEDHVVLYNEKGDSLITSQLTWDEKNDKIYTDRFVRLTKKDRIIMGYGFESNQDFSKGRIKAIEGSWSLGEGD